MNRRWGGVRSGRQGLSRYTHCPVFPGSYLNEPTLCFVVFVFSLAVEPFNPQPQLYHIALSRSHKGSFSAWPRPLAGIIFSRGCGGMPPRVSPSSCLPFWNTHLLLQSCWSFISVLPMETFPPFYHLWVGKFWKGWPWNWMTAFLTE